MKKGVMVGPPMWVLIGLIIAVFVVLFFTVILTENAFPGTQKAILNALERFIGFG